MARDRGRFTEEFRDSVATPVRSVALLCLAVVFVLVLQNLQDLVGGSQPVAWAVIGSLALAFAYGFIVSTSSPRCPSTTTVEWRTWNAPDSFLGLLEHGASA